MDRYACFHRRMTEFFIPLVIFVCARSSAPGLVMQDSKLYDDKIREREEHIHGFPEEVCHRPGGVECARVDRSGMGGRAGVATGSDRIL